MTYLKVYHWESIDENLFLESGEKNIVQVNRDINYLKAMEDQNNRVLKYLDKKYPERVFRKSKWNPHDFGSYQEIEERFTNEEEEELI